MIAKYIVCKPTRADAIAAARNALATNHIFGLETNAAFLDRLLAHPTVAAGTMDTGLIGRELETLVQRDQTPQRTAAIARQFLESAAAAADIVGPWAARDAFALGPERARSVVLEINGQRTPLSVHHDRLQPRDAPTTVVAVGDVAALPTQTTWPSARDPHNTSRHHIVAGLDHYIVDWPTYDASAIDDGAGSGAVRAPINGRVAKIFVAEGEAVTKGTRVAIVEAMKMEHSLVATLDGTIEKLAVTEGQQVAQGALIASIA